jgi:sensor domain CHASE-containing protein
MFKSKFVQINVNYMMTNTNIRIVTRTLSISLVLASVPAIPFIALLLALRVLHDDDQQAHENSHEIHKEVSGMLSEIAVAGNSSLKQTTYKRVRISKGNK